MKERELTLEEQADALLEGLARSKGQSLRQLGVMDRRRQRVVARREIPLSRFERKRQEAAEDND